jgi:hypothetical protein
MPRWAEELNTFSVEENSGPAVAQERYYQSSTAYNTEIKFIFVLVLLPCTVVTVKLTV